MSRYSRLFWLHDSIPDDNRREVPVSRWPVYSVATSAHLGTVVSSYDAMPDETEYLPQMPNGTVIPGIYRARYDAAMALYAKSEGGAAALGAEVVQR